MKQIKYILICIILLILLFYINKNKNEGFNFLKLFGGPDDPNSPLYTYDDGTPADC